MRYRNADHRRHFDYFAENNRCAGDSALGTQQIIAGKFADVVERFFNKFASETSDEKLELARDEITQRGAYFCGDPAHKSVCEQTKR